MGSKARSISRARLFPEAFLGMRGAVLSALICVLLSGCSTAPKSWPVMTMRDSLSVRKRLVEDALARPEAATRKWEEPLREALRELEGG